MATNIDTGLTAANAYARMFTMSDGYLVAVYLNGTNWVYRTKPPGGSWSAATTITGAAQQAGQWDQGGNTIYGVVSGQATPSAIGIKYFKLVYSTGTHAITQSNYDWGDGNSPSLAVYWDNTLGRIVEFEHLSDVGPYVRSMLGSTLATEINEAMTANSPPSAAGSMTPALSAVAGDGGSTFFFAWIEGTTFKVNRIVDGADVATLTETAETGPAALAAAGVALDAIYDGTDIVFIVNENNAAIRVCRRTAQDTYTAWTTIDTAAVGLKAELARKLTTSDIVATYRRNAGQANGEIYKISRRSGSWDASPTLVAGGAATGWSAPGTAPSDANQGTAGNIPIAYVTGTASPWTLVEDAVSVGDPPQQIRPDADLDATGWSTAPLWSKIDEASAGGDVITSTAV